MSIISTVPKGAAVEGINPNLLRNWYFVGGGTGRGIFPVNQRGQSSYSTPSETNIDGWRFSSSGGQINLLSNGLEVSVLLNNQNFNQELSQARDYYLSKTLTLSALTTSGELYTITGETPSSHPAGTSTILNKDVGTFGLLVFGYFGGNTSKYYVGFINMSTSITTETFKAIKLELGTEQTLAHQENGVWVLNEIPDYEEEFIKCQTSTADSSDALANKSLATEQQLGYIENGNIATRSYVVNEYITLYGNLYRVTSPIAVGETIINNTNCVRTTVGENLGQYVLLYTNPNSGQSFSTKNINISDMSVYNLLLIEYRVKSDGGIYDYVILPTRSTAIAGPMHLYWSGTSAITIGYRTFTAASNAVTVGSGYRRGLSDSSATADDGYMVPIRIYGIKI